MAALAAVGALTAHGLLCRGRRVGDLGLCSATLRYRTGLHARGHTMAAAACDKGAIPHGHCTAFRTARLPRRDTWRHARPSPAWAWAWAWE